MRSAEENELLAAANQIHDIEGCDCDPKYRMSCPRMAAAIMRAGRERRTQ